MSNPPATKPPRIGRKRRTLGWTLLTLGLLVAGVWFGTGVVEIRYIAAYCSLDVRHGRVRVEYPETPIVLSNLRYKSGWSITPLEGSMAQWASEFIPIATGYRYAVSTQSGTRGQGYIVNIWPIPLLLWTPAALLLRSGILARRRANANACIKCGYSLAGLAHDAPCPECGKGAKVTA